MTARLAIVAALLTGSAAAQLLPPPPSGYDPSATIMTCVTAVPAVSYTAGRIEVIDLSGLLQGIVAPGTPKVYLSIDGKMGGMYYRTAVPAPSGAFALTLSPALLDGSPRKVVAWYLGPAGAKVYLDNAAPAAPFAFTIRSTSLKP